jgi:hypothetical protein
MKYLLFSALLLGLVGCSESAGSQANADYKPTALDSATNGLYKVRPQAKHPAPPSPAQL